MSDPIPEIIDLPGAERQARRPRPRYGERALIVCDNLVKIYKVADLEVVALQGLDLLVEPGEMIALVGASGLGQVARSSTSWAGWTCRRPGGPSWPATSWPTWARRSGRATGADVSASSGSRPRGTCCRT